MVVLCLPDSWSNWNLEMVVFKEWGKPEYPEKNIRARERTNNKLNPHMASTPGFEPRATLVGGECSHRCATLALIALALTAAPPLL